MPPASPAGSSLLCAEEGEVYLCDPAVVLSTSTQAGKTILVLMIVLVAGMNAFLKNLNITFRRDPTNYRPRINKMDSLKDQEQKAAGTFYYLED